MLSHRIAWLFNSWVHVHLPQLGNYGLLITCIILKKLSFATINGNEFRYRLFVYYFDESELLWMCVSTNAARHVKPPKQTKICCSPPWIQAKWHYDDVRMGAIASQITSLAIVYSAFYSGVDQRKHQSSASLAFVWGIHRDRWIPRTKGQLRGKWFHLMTSSWYCCSSVVCGRVWRHA